MRRQEVLAFIKSSFRSIWSLELLLYLKQQPWASRSKAQIVSDMRASDTIVTDSMSSLMAAGLIVEEQDGTFRYSPVSENLNSLLDETERLYRVQPDAVRRVIVLGTGNLSAFADSFKLRRD